MTLNKTQEQIYQSFKRANKKVAFVLKNYPVSRDLSNDGFVRVFKKVFPELTYSFETIIRVRRFVQNTKKIYQKTGARPTWEYAILQLKEYGFTVQQDIFERI